MIDKGAIIVTTVDVTNRMLDDELVKDSDIEIFIEFLSWLGCRIYLAPISYSEFEKRFRKFGDETKRRLSALIKDGSDLIGFSPFYGETEHHDALYLCCYLNGVSRKNVSLVLTEMEHSTINKKENETISEVVRKFLDISPTRFEFEMTTVERAVKQARENAEFVKHLSKLNLN